MAGHGRFDHDFDVTQIPPLPLLYNEEVIQEQPDQAAVIERYTEECVRFMRENRDESFFLYLAHMQVSFLTLFSRFSLTILGTGGISGRRSLVNSGTHFLPVVALIVDTAAISVFVVAVYITTENPLLLFLIYRKMEVGKVG